MFHQKFNFFTFLTVCYKFPTNSLLSGFTRHIQFLNQSNNCVSITAVLHMDYPTHNYLNSNYSRNLAKVRAYLFFLGLMKCYELLAILSVRKLNLLVIISIEKMIELTCTPCWNGRAYFKLFALLSTRAHLLEFTCTSSIDEMLLLTCTHFSC
jgi:hypothetical protein